MSPCGSPGLFSSVSASGVRSVFRHVCLAIYCLFFRLPGASPWAVLLGGSCSSGLVTCRCLAPARHVDYSRFILVWPCPVKSFSQKQQYSASRSSSMQHLNIDPHHTDPDTQRNGTIPTCGSAQLAVRVNTDKELLDTWNAKGDKTLPHFPHAALPAIHSLPNHSPVSTKLYFTR